MEIDALTAGKPRPKVTPEEKQRRRDLGLCYYCGVAGHLASAHPEVKKYATAAATSTTSTTLPSTMPTAKIVEVSPTA